MSNENYYEKRNKCIKLIKKEKKEIQTELLELDWYNGNDMNKPTIIKFPYVVNITHIGFRPAFTSYINKMDVILWGKCSHELFHQHNRPCNRNGYNHKSIKNRNVNIVDKITNNKMKIKGRDIDTNVLMSINIENNNVYEKIFKLKTNIKTDTLEIIYNGYYYEDDYIIDKKTITHNYRVKRFYGNIVNKDDSSNDDRQFPDQDVDDIRYNLYNKFLLSKEHKKMNLMKKHKNSKEQKKMNSMKKDFKDYKDFIVF